MATTPFIYTAKALAARKYFSMVFLRFSFKYKKII